MTFPYFLIWRCAGCGAPAEGKKKPCGCATNVGVRKGPKGKTETTWWDDPLTNSDAMRQEIERLRKIETVAKEVISVVRRTHVHEEWFDSLARLMRVVESDVSPVPNVVKGEA